MKRTTVSRNISRSSSIQGMTYGFISAEHRNQDRSPDDRGLSIGLMRWQLLAANKVRHEPLSHSLASSGGATRFELVGAPFVARLDSDRGPPRLLTHHAAHARKMRSSMIAAPADIRRPDASSSGPDSTTTLFETRLYENSRGPGPNATQWTTIVMATNITAPMMAADGALPERAKSSMTMPAHSPGKPTS